MSTHGTRCARTSTLGGHCTYTGGHYGPCSWASAVLNAAQPKCGELDTITSKSCTRSKNHEGPCSWTEGRCNANGPNGMLCQGQPGHTAAHQYKTRDGGSPYTWANDEISKPIPASLDIEKIAKLMGTVGFNHKCRISTTKDKDGRWYFYQPGGHRVSSRGITDRELAACVSDNRQPPRPGAFDPIAAILEGAKEEERWEDEVMTTLTLDHKAKVLRYDAATGSRGRAHGGWEITTARGEVVFIEDAEAHMLKQPEAISQHVGDQLAKYRVQGAARFDTTDDDFKKRRKIHKAAT